jgi:hemerythrin-like domain-containing protein
MPVQIGAPAHHFSNPTGLLSDCHRRIEMFLATLKRVAENIDQTPSEEMARALDSALRYFREAAPKHTADEEESLFPRLRQISNSELTSAFSQLHALEEEHRWANSLHAKVEQLGTKYLSGTTLSGDEVASFRAAIRDLGSMYERHIGLEDNTIFPLATRLLNENDKSAIASEMEARRTKVNRI